LSRLQERAAKLQDSGAAIMGAARKAMIIIPPVVAVPVIYLSRLIFSQSIRLPERRAANDFVNARYRAGSESVLKRSRRKEKLPGC
jgi:uncharacterized membrane protein